MLRIFITSGPEQQNFRVKVYYFGTHSFLVEWTLCWCHLIQHRSTEIPSFKRSKENKLKKLNQIEMEIIKCELVSKREILHMPDDIICDISILTHFYNVIKLLLFF